jgi:hypothetical protein
MSDDTQNPLTEPGAPQVDLTATNLDVGPPWARDEAARVGVPGMRSPDPPGCLFRGCGDNAAHIAAIFEWCSRFPHMWAELREVVERHKTSVFSLFEES